MKTPSQLIAATAVFATTLFTICACSTTPAGTNPAICDLTDDNGQPIPTDFTGTLGTTHQGHAANHVNEIQSVQAARCDGFDRLVFAVDGIHEPTYTIEYGQPLFTDCGSGNTHTVPGNAWLTIRMTPAQGHGDGQPTLPRDTTYECVNLRHLAITCDFEAELMFVVGLDSIKPYRVIELQNPTRLVVDIKH